MKHNRVKLSLIPKIFAPAIATAFILLATGVICQAQEFSPRARMNKFAQQPSNNSANAMFSGGRDLIDEAQWARAEEKFAAYVSAYPKEKNADAAMYWMAYSQYKLNKFDKCKDTIGKLLKTYDKTSWKQDAEMLLAQVPQGTKVKVDPVVVEPVVVDPVVVSVSVDPVEVEVRTQEIQERIAEAQARSQERVKEAQARTQERLKEAQERMKNRTIFKYDLNMSMDEAGSDDDPCEFKIVVLQALFQSDVQRGIAAATEWLKPGSTQTTSCKSAALRLLSRNGGKAVTPIILSVAQNETDLKLRARAISALGATNDDSVIDPLRDFALNSPQSDISEAALYALSQHTGPRAMTVLSEIAVSNKPFALRRVAISSIASRQGEPPVDALIRIYDGNQDLETRKVVISGLAHRRSERAGTKLLEIARSSENIELRKSAISAVSRRNGEQSVETLLSLYDSERNEELKDQIIFSLAYSNDPRVTHKLIEIARNPQTPIERRKHAIAWLSRSKDPEVLKFLEDLLRQ